MLLNESKGLKAKGRKEMRREKRVLPIGGAFSAVWGHKLVGCCVRSLAWPLVSRVRTQLMCGEDTTVSSLPNYRLRISSQTPQSSRSLLFSQSSKSFLPRSRLKSVEVEMLLRGSDKIHRCDDKRTRWERTLTTEQLTSSSKETKEGQVQ